MTSHFFISIYELGGSICTCNLKVAIGCLVRVGRENWQAGMFQVQLEILLENPKEFCDLLFFHNYVRVGAIFDVFNPQFESYILTAQYLQT